MVTKDLAAGAVVGGVSGQNIHTFNDGKSHKFKRVITMIPDKRRIYDRLPESLKDVIGWGLRRFPRFRWEPTSAERAYMAALEESEYASPEELQAIQLKKLRALLVHAGKHVPYFRELFRSLNFRPEALAHIEDLRVLPLLTKDLIRSEPDRFISDHIADKSTLTQITTGGSTGTPMIYYFDRHMIGVRRATWWRWARFSGVDLYKDRMVYCGGAPSRWIYSPEHYRGLVNYERTRLTLSSAAMSDNVLDRYIDDIRRYRGEFIRGYASGLYMLARRVIERGTTLHFKAALTSSDTLFPQYREVIEQAFGCNVHDHYGQNEDILTATECGVEPGLHINVESCIPETVNSAGEVVHGVEGRLVSTHLENYVMPLIRYVVGDVGKLQSPWDKCACGRSHQKLLEFTGRADEIIITPQGRRVGCGSMNQPMKAMHSSIEQCQFIQERIDELRVKIVPTAKWDPNVHRAEFMRNLRMQVGENIRITIDLVNAIPARPNGKYQFIVSKLNKEQLS